MPSVRILGTILLGFPFVRRFHLSEDGVACERDGLFVGGVPLLEIAARFGGRETWRVRPASQIEAELSACYGLPVDAASKAGGLESVARALSDGDLALARIAAVLLQFPDPPRLGKSRMAPEDLAGLAKQLAWSGLLKDWDPAQHPRAGVKPNPGWFTDAPRAPKPARAGWPQRGANIKIRNWAEEYAVENGWKAALGLASGELEVELAVEALMKVLKPIELNGGEDRAIAQMKAYADPPKSLDELHSPPTKNVIGYERHHIVEQNPSNLQKDGFADFVASLDKFGRERIDDPNNLVWVPRLKHEKISAEYSEKDESDPLGRRLRDVVKGMDFEEQRQIGLGLLRKNGVLK